MTTKTIAALDKSLSRMSLHANRTWTAKQFQKQFSKYFSHLNNIDLNDQNSRVNRFAPAYTDINKLLRKRGIAIKSSNYCSSFHIIEDAGAKVTYLSHKVQRINTYRDELATGIRNHGGVYSRLTPAEVDSIAGQSAFRIGAVPYGH